MDDALRPRYGVLDEYQATPDPAVLIMVSLASAGASLVRNAVDTTISATIAATIELASRSIFAQILMV